MAGRETQRGAGSESRRPKHDPRGLIEQLMEVLGEPRADTAFVCALALRLQEILERRFATEEDSGRYEEVLAESPWLAASAQVLKEQHGELRWVLREICEQARLGDGSPLWRR